MFRLLRFCCFALFFYFTSSSECLCSSFLFWCVFLHSPICARPSFLAFRCSEILNFPTCSIYFSLSARPSLPSISSPLSFSNLSSRRVSLSCLFVSPSMLAPSLLLRFFCLILKNLSFFEKVLSQPNPGGTR